MYDEGAAVLLGLHDGMGPYSLSGEVVIVEKSEDNPSPPTSTILYCADGQRRGRDGRRYRLLRHERTVQSSREAEKRKEPGRRLRLRLFHRVKYPRNATTPQVLTRPGSDESVTEYVPRKPAYTPHQNTELTIALPRKPPFLPRRKVNLSSHSPPTKKTTSNKIQNPSKKT